MSVCVWLASAASSLAQAPLTIQVQHHFGRESLLPENVALRTKHNVVSVSRVAYLVSNVALVNSAGERVPLGDGVAFIDGASRKPRTTLHDGAAPAGAYTQLTFDIGVPAAINHADPAQWAADHALNPAVNNLHWNWQGGYVFFALEGRWVQPDDSLGGYVFHVATQEHLMRVSTPVSFTHTDEPTRITLSLDLAKVFAGEGETHAVQLTTDPATHTTHSAPADSLAATLARNIERAFSVLAAERGTEAVIAPTGDARDAGHAERAAGTTPFVLAIPQHFPRVALPSDNPLTQEGVTLGERLFFDVRLSGNDVQSCASCHVPSQAFTDAKRVAEGAYGDQGKRNTMTLVNLAWSQASGFTWDGRKARIRDQALQPIEDAREMRQSLTAAIDKLSQDDAYPTMFAAAFGSPDITSDRIGLALEQYLLTLVAARSKYDRVVRGEATFTPEEQRGFDLFNGEYDPARGQLGADCFHCHGGHLFTNHQFINNGLEPGPLQASVLKSRGLDDAAPPEAPALDTLATDPGRAGVTDRLIDRGRFKVPTLRNIAKTAPYMHDGRFATLMEVLQHYSTSVQPSPGLDPNLAKHLKANARIAGSEHHAGVNLSEDDKAALVAFLLTLSDEPPAADADQHSTQREQR